MKVETASAVVDSGIFGYTRNPMYLRAIYPTVLFTFLPKTYSVFWFSFVFVIYMNQFLN
ncbi:hypothetical protein O9992_01365 [Vibrio lentus]|nr:hypothetical protein [Vibrio lentus]